MIFRSFVVVGTLVLFLNTALAEDFIKEAQEANAHQDSPFVKYSSDHRVKATILYVGPMSEKFIDYVFIIAYMVEDCGSEEEFQRNTSKNPPPAGRVSAYALFPAAQEVKDGTHHVVGPPGGNYLEYNEALREGAKLEFPYKTLPTVEHPGRARIYQCFYKNVLTGPLEITLHDFIPAYGPNTFRFRDIDPASFTSH